jgi:hypothetical protein
MPGIFFRQFCYYLARSDGRAGHNHPFYPFYLFLSKPYRLTIVTPAITNRINNRDIYSKSVDSVRR